MAHPTLAPGYSLEAHILSTVTLFGFCAGNIFPSVVWHNFIPLFIPESCSHITQSETYFIYQTTTPPDQSFPPTTSISTSKELFLEIRALWAQNELFMGGNHLSQKVCLMKNLCFEVQKARLKCGCYQLISR